MDNLTRPERGHGTRVRYLWGARGQDPRNGCRCVPCRSATVLYEKRRVAARARGEDAFVDATAAREHLAALRAAGMGTRSAAAASGVSRNQVVRIAAGRVTAIRPETSAAILTLARTDVHDGATVDAAATVELIDDLLARGYTRARLAELLGYRSPSLQLGRSGRVTRANARRVARLWWDLTGAPGAPPQ